MGNFWELEDGTDATQTDGQFDSGGGDLEPIPHKTGCVAAVEEIKWDSYESDRFINIRWRVLKPSEYQNRVVFQKIYPFGREGKKPEYGDKHKRMLAAIDKNAGGKLARVEGEPSDEDLMSAIAGKMMGIMVMKWTIKAEDSRGGTEQSGNWVSAVSPTKKGGAAPATASKPAPNPAPKPATAPVDDFDDDIPF